MHTNRHWLPNFISKCFGAAPKSAFSGSCSPAMKGAGPPGSAPFASLRSNADDLMQAGDGDNDELNGGTESDTCAGGAGADTTNVRYVAVTGVP
jgi:Ca2+-binding RTX toxin-like protein